MREKLPILIVGNTKQEAAVHAAENKLHQPYLAMGRNELVRKTEGLRVSHIFVMRNAELDMKTEMALLRTQAKIELGIETIRERVLMQNIRSLEARLAEAEEKLEEVK